MPRDNSQSCRYFVSGQEVRESKYNLPNSIGSSLFVLKIKNGVAVPKIAHRRCTKVERELEAKAKSSRYFVSEQEARESKYNLPGL